MAPGPSKCFFKEVIVTRCEAITFVLRNCFMASIPMNIQSLRQYWNWFSQGEYFQIILVFWDIFPQLSFLLFWKKFVGNEIKASQTGQERMYNVNSLKEVLWIPVMVAPAPQCCPYSRCRGMLYMLYLSQYNSGEKVFTIEDGDIKMSQVSPVRSHILMQRRWASAQVSAGYQCLLK